MWNATRSPAPPPPAFLHPRRWLLLGSRAPYQDSLNGGFFTSLSMEGHASWVPRHLIALPRCMVASAYNVYHGLLSLRFPAFPLWTQIQGPACLLLFVILSGFFHPLPLLHLLFRSRLRYVLFLLSLISSKLPWYSIKVMTRALRNCIITKLAHDHCSQEYYVIVGNMKHILISYCVISSPFIT